MKRSASGTGNGRRAIELNKAKMAEFTPMPSASVSTATAVKPGFFSSWRMANLRSFMVRCLVEREELEERVERVEREERESVGALKALSLLDALTLRRSDAVTSYS